MSKILVYLVCGFFGAGKTTFLRNVRDELLETRKFAYLLNEYGDSHIDGTRLDDGLVNFTGIDGGSIFCSCRHWDFIEALKRLVATDADTIIIECPGLADPSPLTDDIAIVNSLSGNALEYRGNICVIDTVNFLDALEVYEAIGKQLTGSKVILINKTDLASTDVFDAVELKTKELAPDATIFTTIQAWLPFSRIEGLLAKTLPSPGMEGINTPDNRPGSFSLVASAPVETYALRDFLEGLIGEVLRVKGHCWLDSGWNEVDLVGRAINIAMSSKSSNQTELLLIISPGSTAMEKIEARWNKMIAKHSIV
ncbi:MAG TPA: GTP-binding protein [Candidatus Lokiarchaeia archaeon]|nr:GTP-binding protein [Candidatus Lokiarchaeia archaeon]